MLVFVCHPLDVPVKMAGNSRITGKTCNYHAIAINSSGKSGYKAKGREASWMESALRAVEVLCFGEMGHVLSQSPAFDVGLLLDYRITALFWNLIR